MTRPIIFGAQIGPESRTQFLDEVRQAEDLGYASVSVADHPASMASCFASLCAAAAITERVRLGPYVANAGLRHPLDLAVETATLDMLSDGRAFLGLGAGHTPAEWERKGLERPTPGQRISRMIEVADAASALLRGETVTVDGEHVQLVEAVISEPRTIQAEVPLVIGGNNRRLLTYASKFADVVALSGLGRTLADGHRHEVHWSAEQLTSMMSRVHEGASLRPDKPRLESLVQMSGVTNSPESQIAEVSERLEVPAEHLRQSPFVLLGSLNQIVERLHENLERWGISSYVIRGPAVADFGAVIEKLR